MRLSVARKHSRSLGLTLVELMMAIAVGSLVLVAVANLSLFGARSLAALVNYADLDSKSRYAADVIGRELRQATMVTAFNTNLPVKSMTLTNADQGATLKLTYDSNARTLALEKTGKPKLVALTECDRWDFSLYNRVPYGYPTNLLFYPATNGAGTVDPKLCKLIDMSWKCTRTILAKKVNSESVQTAKIVLRNKIK
jgi:hypothetical protein